MDNPASRRSSPDILQHPDWLACSWLLHGFSTRGGGNSIAYAADGELNLGFTPEDDPVSVRSNRTLLVNTLLAESPVPGEMPSLITIRQVHSAEMHTVDTTAKNAILMTGDGLLTAAPGLLLGILTADCVPVLIADMRRRVVGAFHAGWRGTVQRIVEKGAAEMIARFGSKPADLGALIGPAIGACCYIVGSEVRERFLVEFEYGAEVMSLVPEAVPGTVKLDLREANRRQLLTAGLPGDRIHLAGSCTSCEPQRYFSHRQSGGRTGRMMSVVGIAKGRELA